LPPFFLSSFPRFLPNTQNRVKRFKNPLSDLSLLPPLSLLPSRSSSSPLD
jgi:hypothetical protein